MFTGLCSIHKTSLSVAYSKTARANSAMSVVAGCLSGLTFQFLSVFDLFHSQSCGILQLLCDKEQEPFLLE